MITFNSSLGVPNRFKHQDKPCLKLNLKLKLELKLILNLSLVLNWALNLKPRAFGNCRLICADPETSTLLPPPCPLHEWRHACSRLLVMGPGGYKFSDYIKLGVPLTLVIFVAVMIMLPIFWPLTPAG